VRRRILAAVAIVATVAITGYGLAHHSPRHVRLWVTQPAPRGLTICASTDCGPRAATLHWTLPPFPNTSGYYVLLNAVQVADVVSPSYTLGGMDCGTTFTLGVEAHDSSGGHGSLFTTTYTSPACASGSTVVGTAGSPTPTCTATVPVNGNVDSALTSGGANAVVCLASGSWNEIDLTSTHTASNVTIRAATPGSTTVNSLRLQATTANLTVEGLTMTQGFYVEAAASSETFRYNTMEAWSAADAQTNAAFFLDPGFTGALSSSGTAIQMLYNQVDDVPQCLQDDTNGGNTFSHNVCGPAIGNGGSPDVHYTQTDGLSNETIDNNVFEGPLAAGAGGHINVSHMAGNNDRFDNNILWHVGGDQHLQFNDDSASTSLETNNNLDVEDPSESGGAFEQIASNFSLSGFTQTVR